VHVCYRLNPRAPAGPASAHLTPQHAELVVATANEVTSGRLIVHRDVVTPARAGAWAAGLLGGGCPVNAYGVGGGVPNGVVVELAWSCAVDDLDLAGLLREGGLSEVIAEFNGTVSNVTSDLPIVDAIGAHEPPAPLSPWWIVMAAVLGLILLVLVLPVSPLRAWARRATAGLRARRTAARRTPSGRAPAYPLGARRRAYDHAGGGRTAARCRDGRKQPRSRSGGRRHGRTHRQPGAHHHEPEGR
jgi:hypothetical protein